MTKHLAVAALALAAFAACEPNRGVTEPRSAVRASLTGPQNDDQRDGDGGPRAVYTLTNQVAGNAVAVFARAGDGTLTPAGSFSTGGAGTGAGLGSQGAVTLSNDGRLLFAVNAGSNDVSVFRVNPEGLSLLSRTPSGGTLPASVTDAAMSSASARVGATPKPQLPITVVVTPCQGEIDSMRSHRTCAS